VVHDQGEEGQLVMKLLASLGLSAAFLFSAQPAAALNIATLRSEEVCLKVLKKANRQRLAPQLKNCDFSYANLRSANLSKADLRGSRFFGADLSFANLSFANLRGAQMNSANLKSASLRSAKLLYSNFSYAILRGANLSSADVRETRFTAADLTGANIGQGSTRINLNDAYLNYATLPDGSTCC
jgi:uncharacterized protein YjbI with pentapeptide repeats